MAQQFTHTARAPKIPESHPHQRWFKFTSDGDENITSLVRRHDEDVAVLSACIGSLEGSISFNASLTAAACEALARYLLDAAADLRAHSAAELIAANTEHNPDEVAA